jgi:predicted AlkP superfamily pyrophosphatase or phosphodiesterase
MLVISFDAVGNDEFERLLSYPTVGAFAKNAAVFRDVSTVFVSNTYPIHTSVATGLPPGKHGLRANTEPYPARHPVWNSGEGGIKARTVWQAAREKGIDTAAVFWPVTAYSTSIRWNMPEVLARPGKSQLITSLKAGNALMQLQLFLRHRKLFEGVKQPQLDNFATACMCDILHSKKPGLALIHFTVYDTLCHRHGKGSKELSAAFETLDKNLAALLDAAKDEPDVLIFSDHSQINVHTVVTVNDLLKEMKLNNCFFECCGGSAFFNANGLSRKLTDEVKRRVEESEGFRRFLTEDEMREAGYFTQENASTEEAAVNSAVNNDAPFQDQAAFGFTAQAGYSYEAYPKEDKATHGYALDMPNYKVFYMVKGFGLAPGERRGGSLLDIAPLVAKRLELTMPLI